MKMQPSVLIVCLVALGIACSSVRTSHDFDPGADFSDWRSYAWYPSGSPATGDPRLDNPLLHARIQSAIDRDLGARGYTKVVDRTPDFYVNYHLSTEQRLNVRTMNTGYAGGPHGRRWGGAGWGGVGWTETRVEQFEEGTLVIDLVEEDERRLVWRGSGTRRLSSDSDPERVTKRVNEAVTEIMAQFPPK